MRLAKIDWRAGRRCCALMVVARERLRQLVEQQLVDVEPADDDRQPARASSTWSRGKATPNPSG